MKKGVVEVTTYEAGGFGDIAGLVRIAEHLSPDYHVILSLGRRERRKFKKIMEGTNHPDWEIVRARKRTNAPVRIAAFASHNRFFKKKKQANILVNQYAYSLNPDTTDISFYTGFIPDTVSDTFYGCYGDLFATGLYIPREPIKCSKTVAAGKFREFARTHQDIRHLQEDIVDTDRLWGTYYSGSLGTDGLFFDMLKEAEDRFPIGKNVTVFTFLNRHHFKKYVAPKADALGFNWYDR